VGNLRDAAQSRRYWRTDARAIELDEDDDGAPRLEVRGPGDRSPRTRAAEHAGSAPHAHGGGSGDAPAIGEAALWNARLARGGLGSW
jgi:hypothetical protein